MAAVHLVQEGHPSYADLTIPKDQRDDLAVVTVKSPGPAGVPVPSLPAEWQLEDLKEAGELICGFWIVYCG